MCDAWGWLKHTYSNRQDERAHDRNSTSSTFEHGANALPCETSKQEFRGYYRFGTTFSEKLPQVRSLQYDTNNISQIREVETWPQKLCWQPDWSGAAQMQLECVVVLEQATWIQWRRGLYGNPCPGNICWQSLILGCNG